MADRAPSSLGGKRIVITRAEYQSAALAAALRAHGAEVDLLPLIQILPPLDYAQLDSALCKSAYFDWLFFTSQNAVTAREAIALPLNLFLACRNLALKSPKSSPIEQSTLRK